MLAQSRAAFEAVPDFTVAVEEEFALIDPETLDLVNRFEELQEAAQGTELEPHLVGELIASEIEVRTGRCDSFADAAALLGERRQQLRAVAESRGVALGSTGTHPWSPWQEQRPGPRDPRLFGPPELPAGAAGALRELAVRGRRLLGAPLGAHADLHADV